MLVLFLYCAFKSGADRYYMRKIGGFGVKGKELFHYLKPRNVLSLILFYVNYYLRKLVLFILCFAPCLLMIFLLCNLLYYGEVSLSFAAVIIFTVIICGVNGVVFYFRFNSFLFLARYYFVSDKFYNFRQLFSFAYACLEGKRGAVLRKKLSFLGWFISCLFLLPIGFVRAYYRESMVILAKGLIED